MLCQSQVNASSRGCVQITSHFLERTVSALFQEATCDLHKFPTPRIHLALPQRWQCPVTKKTSSGTIAISSFANHVHLPTRQPCWTSGLTATEHANIGGLAEVCMCVQH